MTSSHLYVCSSQFRDKHRSGRRKARGSEAKSSMVCNAFSLPLPLSLPTQTPLPLPLPLSTQTPLPLSLPTQTPLPLPLSTQTPLPLSLPMHTPLPLPLSFATAPSDASCTPFVPRMPALSIFPSRHHIILPVDCRRIVRALFSPNSFVIIRFKSFHYVQV